MLKIGCDPEFFVKKNGEFVSAHGLIPGTKENPYKVKGGAVQVDGMALEFNIDPALSVKQFRNNIHTVLTELRGMVGEEYEFVFNPTAEFSQEVMNAQPEEALILGCDPDFNAWNDGKENPTPNADGKNFRTASGHIHFGWVDKADMDIKDPEHIEACCMLSRSLDRTLALLSTLWDDDHKRRELYGGIGAFRPKPYGMEYRTLSNAWLNDPTTIDIVYTVAFSIFNSLIDGNHYIAEDNPSGRKYIEGLLSGNSNQAYMFVRDQIALPNLVTNFADSIFYPEGSKRGDKVLGGDHTELVRWAKENLLEVEKNINFEGMRNV